MTNSQEVHHRAGPEGPPDRGRLPDAGVIGRREEKTDPGPVQRAPGGVGRAIEIEAKGLEHIGRAGVRRRGPVAVLGNRDPRRRGDEGGGGGDVHRAQVVAAGPAGIGDPVGRARKRPSLIQHRERCAGDLLGRLTPGLHRDEERGDLDIRHRAAQDVDERLVALPLGQASAGEGVEEFSGWHREPKS